MSNESDLGPCCGCNTRPAGRNVVMLHRRSMIPGHGWGCFVCHLPTDGAVAVLCDACVVRMEAGADVIRYACRGYPGTDGRAPIEEFTQPFEHDQAVHEADEARQ